MSRDYRYLIAALLAVIFFYLFVLQIHASWSFTIDDMYITLRYAKNWANGIGLLWNANELPVEGYSNFSFVLLGRVAIQFGLNPVLVFKSAGVFGLLVSCIALYGVSRYWLSPLLALVPSLWMLAYQGEILWSVSGLETAVYQALIISSVFFILKETRNGLCIASLLLAIASLTRPETPGLVFLFGVVIASRRRSNPVAFALPFLILFIPYFLWRWQYYGQLFPNPVYCKGMSASLRFILDKQFLKLIWPFGLLSAIAIFQIKDKRHYFLWLPAIFYCVVLMNADPIVAFDNRLFLPAFALLLPLAFIPIARLRTINPILPYLIAIIWAGLFIPMKSLSAYRYFTENPIAGEKLRLSVVDWLDKNTSANSKVVLADAGLIPYYSNHPFIDSYCLNNREMGRLSSEDMFEEFCETIWSKRPQVIILTSLVENGRVIYTPADACLAQQLSKRRDYALKRRFSTGGYRYDVYGSQ